MLYSVHLRRFAPVLAFYLLVVSVGLPLQRVYCACVGEVSWQLFSQPHECKHDAVHTSEANSCKLNSSSSCCAPMAELREGAKTQGDSCAEHNCGYTEVVMAQFDAEFPPLDEAATLPTIFAGIAPAQGIIALPHPSLYLLRPHPIRGPDPPPLPFGRQLLVWQQTFLI